MGRQSREQETGVDAACKTQEDRAAAEPLRHGGEVGVAAVEERLDAVGLQALDGPEPLDPADGAVRDQAMGPQRLDRPEPLDPSAAEAEGVVRNQAVNVLVHGEVARKILYRKGLVFRGRDVGPGPLGGSNFQMARQERSMRGDAGGLVGGIEDRTRPERVRVGPKPGLGLHDHAEAAAEPVQLGCDVRLRGRDQPTENGVETGLPDGKGPTEQRRRAERRDDVADLGFLVEEQIEAVVALPPPVVVRRLRQGSRYARGDKAEAVEEAFRHVSVRKLCQMMSQVGSPAPCGVGCLAIGCRVAGDVDQGRTNEDCVHRHHVPGRVAGNPDDAPKRRNPACAADRG